MLHLEWTVLLLASIQLICVALGALCLSASGLVSSPVESLLAYSVFLASSRSLCGGVAGPFAVCSLLHPPLHATSCSLRVLLLLAQFQAFSSLNLLLSHDAQYATDGVHIVWLLYDGNDAVFVSPEHLPPFLVPVRHCVVADLSIPFTFGVIVCARVLSVVDLLTALRCVRRAATACRNAA